MFDNHFSTSSWNKLGSIGQEWSLLRFEKHEPPSWEDYRRDQRKYWGADASDQTRVHNYFGKTKTEENLLNDCKKKYKDFKEHLFHWNGNCKVGEKVQVICIEPNVIVLSKNWTGEVSDHSDLELWLKEEKTFFGKHVRFCCEIYSFGTVVVMPGSTEAAMGERVGSSRVTHREGKSRDHNETVSLNTTENIIAVGDALFRISRK